MRKTLPWVVAAVLLGAGPAFSQSRPGPGGHADAAHGAPTEALADLGSAQPDAIGRVQAVLGSGSAGLQSEICRSLAADPGRFRSEYLTGAVKLLAHEDASVRQAAAAALAACRLEPVTAELIAALRDATAPDAARRAAVEALLGSFSRARIGALVSILGGLPPELANYACAQLTRIAGRPLDDVPSVSGWWGEASAMDESAWKDAVLLRLADRVAQAERDGGALERRLIAALRANYLRTEQPAQAAILLEYMGDALPAVRSLGLSLLEAALTEGDPGPGAAESARLLLADTSASVRISAARAVAAFREPLDEALFLTQLADEPTPAVQQALVSALGYVGGDGSVSALLKRARSANASLAMDAIVALGRIGQRGALSGDTAVNAAADMRQLLHSDSSSVDLRAAALVALASTGDPSADAELRAALASAETPLLSAGLRGVTLLGAPTGPARRLTEPENQALAAAVEPLTRHADAAIRRQAVEALGWTATSGALLEPLAERLTESEPDDSVRAAAWRALLTGLNRRPWEEWLPWLERARAGGGPEGGVVQLLEAAEAAALRDNAAGAARAEIRRELVAAYAAAGDTEKALKAGLSAVTDLAETDRDAAVAAGRDALRLALVSGRYTPEVAAALNRLDVPAETWWEVSGRLIEERLRGPTLADALAMLAALRAAPLGREPEGVAAQMDELQGRAQRMQGQAVGEAVQAELVRLRENPDDEAALQRIRDLGLAALPHLRAFLLDVLAADPPDAEAEQRLLDLIRSIQPDWPGYAPELPPAEKRKAVEELSA